MNKEDATPISLQKKERGDEQRNDEPTYDDSIQPETDRVYPAALRATLALVPITAVVFTVGALFAFGGVGPHAVTIGVVASIIAWLSGALFARGCVTPRSADSRTYHLIREKLDRLDNRAKYLCEASENNASMNGKNGIDNIGTQVTVRNIVCRQVQQECRKIEGLIKSVGMPWATRLGYVELWRRIHRAEEALIKVQPETEVLSGAMRDELRLSDSNMKNRESLLKRLREAVTVLDSTGTDASLAYVERPKGSVCSDEERQKREMREKALTILSEIRYEINYFRDKGSEGIIHARNRLAATSVVLGSATYVLLALIIFADAAPGAILAASAYFLVGTLTGLFARSQAEWVSDTAVSDYGLSAARLLHVPWLSGLAAVSGVLVVSVVDNQFMNPGEVQSMTMTDIFQYAPSFFVVAAVFGLTPDLLIRRLSQQAEIYKGDLESTETSQSTKSTQPTQIGSAVG